MDQPSYTIRSDGPDRAGDQVDDGLAAEGAAGCEHSVRADGGNVGLAGSSFQVIERSVSTSWDGDDLGNPAVPPRPGSFQFQQHGPEGHEGDIAQVSRAERVDFSTQVGDSVTLVDGVFVGGAAERSDRGFDWLRASSLAGTEMCTAVQSAVTKSAALIEVFQVGGFPPSRNRLGTHRLFTLAAGDRSCT